MAMGSKNQILAMATGQRLGPGTDQLPAMATDQRPAMAMPTSQRPRTATNQRLVTATGQCPATVIDTNQCPGADVPLGRQPIHQTKNPLRCRRTCPHLRLVDDDPRARTLPSLPGRAPIAECQERAHLALIGLRPPAADPLHQYGMSPVRPAAILLIRRASGLRSRKQSKHRRRQLLFVKSRSLLPGLIIARARVFVRPKQYMRHRYERHCRVC